jgi:hypothetical protein
MVTKKEAVLALCKSNLSEDETAEIVMLMQTPIELIRQLRSELEQNRDSTSVDSKSPTNLDVRQTLTDQFFLTRPELKQEAVPIQSFQNIEGLLNLILHLEPQTPVLLQFPTEQIVMQIERRDLDCSLLLQEISTKSPRQVT